MAAPKKIPAPKSSNSSAPKGEDEQSKRIAKFIDDLNLAYGDGSAFYGKKAVKTDVYSTGSLTLDEATGVGGFPKGRIIEIFGPESSGKTTICLKFIASVQQSGGLCAFIDMEQALDPAWATKIGVNMDKIVFSQPESGEQAMDTVLRCIQSGLFAAIVVDSVAALTPKAEISGEIGDSHVGLQARLMTQSLRMINQPLNATNTILVFTNQIRDIIGMTGYGPTTSTPGGKALKFYASMRLEVKRIQTIKTGEVATGALTKVEFKKNKVAAPFTKAELTIRFIDGISLVDEIAEMAIKMGLIEKRGAYFKVEGETVAQGREKLNEWLKGNPLKCFGFHRAVLKELKMPDIDVAPDYGKTLAEKAEDLVPSASTLILDAPIDFSRNTSDLEDIPDDFSDEDEDLDN